MKNGRVSENSYLEFCRRMKEMGRLPKAGLSAEQLLDGIEEARSGNYGLRRERRCVL